MSVEPLTVIDESRIGLTANGTPSAVSMSDDGQVIAFQSDAPDLVPNDLNNLADIFVYYPGTDRLELISENAAGTNSANAASTNPRVSPDGRYVMFESTARDLVPNGNSTRQLYVRDLLTQSTSVISVTNDGIAGNGASQAGWWSGDSTKVVFESFANNFSTLDSNNYRDVYLRDLTAQTTTLLSTNREGTAAGNAQSYSPQISRDGNSVVFVSYAQDFIENDLTNIEDVYIRDLTTGSIEIASIDTDGVRQPTAHLSLTEDAISADGRYILFVTGAQGFASMPTFNGNNLYLRDRQLGTTTVISTNATGEFGVGGFSGSITPDGRYITFVSNGGGIDTAGIDQNDEYDIFRRDMVTGVTELVTVNLTGDNGGDGLSVVPRMSDDGRYIAFFSDAGNLSQDLDTNQQLSPAVNRRDIFVRDMQTGVTTNVSGRGNGQSQLYANDRSFTQFAFETLATNFVPGDLNQRVDIIVTNTDDHSVKLASRREPTFPPDVLGGGAYVSSTPDGRYVAFNAAPSADLVPGIRFTGFQISSAYVLDRQTDEIQVVDLTPDPTISGGGFNPLITPDGRYVAFISRVPTGGSVPLVDDVTFTGHFFSGRDVYVRDLVSGETQLVTIDPTGTTSNNGTDTPEHALSNDGRYVAFTSNSDNLVPGISNPSRFIAVYQRDLWTGQTVLVSQNVNNDGVISGSSANLNMSSDGRYVSFTSNANDLTQSDTNNQADIFRWDRVSNTLSLVSVNTDGSAPGNNNSGGNTGFRPVMSQDGRWIAFASRASDLVAGDTNNRDDVFVRDMSAGETILVSTNVSGTNGANQHSTYPTITTDGRTILFLSAANNLTSTPLPGFFNQLYAHDLETGQNQLVSINTLGTAAGNGAVVISPSAVDYPVASSDGRYVVFRSRATDLIQGFVDNNGTEPNVYLNDRQTGVTQLLTYNQSGTGGTSGQDRGVRFGFTSDDTEVLFDTNAPDLYIGDRNNTIDLFAFKIGGAGFVEGKLFVDDDEDGEWSELEHGVAGVSVYVDLNGNSRPDRGESRVITDRDGQYRFTNLAAGTYRIGVQWPGGYDATHGISQIVTLASDSSDATGIDFGAVPAVADLAVTSIAIPSEVSAGAAFTVTWTTSNLAEAAVSGDWQEAVYLSRDDQLDGSDQLLGTVAHSGGLAALASIRRELTVLATVETVGNYHIFVQADRRHQVTADTNRVNNIAFAFDTVTLTVPELVLGAAYEDQFDGVNQLRYYQLDVEQGETIELHLESSANGGATELYASYREFPLPFHFDYAARAANLPDQTLSIALTRPGTYYVLARARSGAAATAPFSVTAVTKGFELASINPQRGPASGRVTVEVRGAGFDWNTGAKLIDGDTQIVAAAIDFRDPTLLYATFDLTGSSVGNYDLLIEDGSNSSNLPDAFVVDASAPAEDSLALSVILPAIVRVGRQGQVVVEYENTGATDIPAPLLRITANHALLRLPGQPSFIDSDLTFYGHAVDGPGGILRPGERGSVMIEFLSTGVLFENIDVQTFRVEPDRQMEWSTIKSDLRPLHMSDEAWDVVFDNFVAQAGATAGEYEELLSGLANHLSNVGIYTADATRLLSMAIALADNAFSTGTLAQSQDAYLPSPGLDLVFARHFRQPIHGRYATGLFGRGWRADWEISLTTLPSGDVTMQSGDAFRYFIRQSTGEYLQTVESDTRLELLDGVYVLISGDGTITRFLPRGKVDSVMDHRGNQITAGYNSAGQLVTLAHSSGSSITLSYNSDGFVTMLTSSLGDVVTYEYEGDHLTGYTDRYGTHSYTYVENGGAMREHALEGVHFSDDTHVLFTYDDRGRLASEQRDGGEQRLTYDYLPSGGGYTVTDATGSAFTEMYGDRGQITRSIDALGRVTNYDYDDNLNLTRVKRPNGTFVTIRVEENTNAVTVTDAAGNDTQFEFDDQLNMTRFRDALNRSTDYKYDDDGNLIEIKYPNGTRQKYSYDPQGFLKTVTNRRGLTTTFDMDSDGRLVRKTFHDGTVATFTYDARGNVLTATDSSGTMTLAYNLRDALERVEYPDGRFLSFEYNTVNQRTRTTDQDGYVVAYSYDDLGRLSEVRDGSDALITRYVYDSTGRVVQRENGNGTRSSYDYDQAGQTVAITHFAPDGSINARFDYVYDRLGRVAQVTLTDNDSATADGMTVYEYDAIGQLISAELPSGRTIEYAYDAVGNRMAVSDEGLVTSYQVNALNEYSRAGGTTYRYDADGNRVAEIGPAGTNLFEYDGENRLVRATGPGAAEVYGYSPLGHRTSAVFNGEATDYLVDPTGMWSVVAEYAETGDLMSRYIYAYGLTGRTDAAGELAYYDFDQTGNTVGITDGAGQYVNRYSYLPFGETTTHAAELDNPFTFIGLFGVRQMNVAGLFDMRFREYDPVVGQFTAVDPIDVLSGQSNLRSYVANDPINANDPVGLKGQQTNSFAQEAYLNFETFRRYYVAPALNDLRKNFHRFLWEPFTDACGRVHQSVLDNSLEAQARRKGKQIYDWARSNPQQFFNTILHTANNIANGTGHAPVGDPPGSFGGGENPNQCENPSGGPPGDPPGPSRSGPGGSFPTGAGFDPNDITGPAGLLEERYIEVDQTLPYTIRFENLSSASAAAQEVFVTHELDEDLDLSTFELGDFGFGDLVVEVPGGLQSYATRVAYQNLDGSPLNVDVTANLDIDSHTVTWGFRSLSPTTGLLPDGVFEGFLPPNDDAGAGEGFVRYVVKAKPDLAVGTTLDQQASIVFDINEPILTNVYTNTIGSGVYVTINEILAHPEATSGQYDAIEIFNAGDEPIDLGGWYLSDSSNNLMKYRFDDGIVLGAQQYFVVEESDFNPTPDQPAANHFSLDAIAGGEVWLAMPDDSLAGLMVVDDVAYEPSVIGTTLGRTPDSRGTFLPQSRATLGCENGPSRPGAVVVSEIQYRPGAVSDTALSVDPGITPDDLRFIELSSASLVTMDLSGWRLRGAVDWDFADGFHLAPGQAIVMVTFDPAEEVQRTAAFRAHYGIGEDVVIVGSSAFEIDNTGGEIRLQRLQLAVDGGPTVTSYVTEDVAEYSELAPWSPTAAGLGDSLQRNIAASLGLDAANWDADRPTPGTTAFEITADIDGDGEVTSRDIDLLFDIVRAEQALAAADFDGSGDINEADIAYLLTNVLHTFAGDANVDGVVDAIDFGVWNESRFSGCGTWARADFNGDGFTDLSDFNIWNANKFRGLPSSSASAAGSSGRAPKAPLPASVVVRDVAGEGTNTSDTYDASNKSQVSMDGPLDPLLVDEVLQQSVSVATQRRRLHERWRRKPMEPSQEWDK
jgi:RHS repeat-associated protein